EKQRRHGWEQQATAVDLGWVEEEETATTRMVGVRAAAAWLQRLQWEMAGIVDGDEEVGRNYGGRWRKKQPRERKESVALVSGAPSGGRSCGLADD
ncbi:hypothetical protein GW17_00043487, partial [Ensete ventricosum]